MKQFWLLFLHMHDYKLQVAESNFARVAQGEEMESGGFGFMLFIFLFLFRSESRFVGVKSVLIKLQRWIYFLWCDSTAAKSQLQLGNCRARRFIIFIHVGALVLALPGCSWSAVNSQLLLSRNPVTTIVRKY